MLTINLVALLQRLFAIPYGKSLEQFIVSRNPTNTSEVENLVREFQLRETRSWL